MIEVDEALQNGKMVWRGNKLYAVCPRCRDVIQMNKPILGSIHFCD